MKRFIYLTALLTMTGCASPQASHIQYLQNKGVNTQQSAQSFQHCHGYGCKFIADVNLNESDWQDIGKSFTPKPQTPERERDAIKQAIALFEQKVGAQTGTDIDQQGTFKKMGSHQLDCVDESTNTTVYLSLLEQQGLLRFHKTEAPTARLPIIHAGRWPHQSAVISEIQTSAFFVVDSWFHDNGRPPEIVTLKQWKEGWKPQADDDKV